MRFVVEFDGAKHGQVVWLAQDKIDMFAVDLVQRRRALAIGLPILRGQQIANTHFSKHAEIISDSQVKNA